MAPSMETASSPEAKAVYRKDAGGFLGQAPKAPRWGLGGQQCPLQVHGVRIVVFALVTSSLLARLIEVPQIRRRLVLFRGHKVAIRAHHVFLLADPHVRIRL